MKLNAFLLFSILSAGLVKAQPDTSSLTYRLELGGTGGNGTYAPLWLTANRYGLSSTNPNSGYLRAGIAYDKQFPRDGGLKQVWTWQEASTIHNPYPSIRYTVTSPGKC